MPQDVSDFFLVCFVWYLEAGTWGPGECRWCLPRWFPWRGIASKLICWGISAFACFGWVDGHGWLVIWRNQLVNDSWDLEHFCLGKIFGIYYMRQFDIANSWERIPWILIVLKNHSNSFGMMNSPLAVWNWCVLKWLGGCCKWVFAEDTGRGENCQTILGKRAIVTWNSKISEQLGVFATCLFWQRFQHHPFWA